MPPGPGKAPEVRATLTEPGKGGPEILIVEDSPTQAMELKLTLEEYGFQTRVAVNGREALDWLNVNTASALVISDIVMPELDGYELCRAIRRSEKLRDTPLIMLSNLSNLADILKGLESGASNFMVKPFDKRLLISYIQKELARRDEVEAHLPSQTFTIEHGGRKYSISSNVRQLADILLATYGTALHKNDELIKAQTELRLLNEHLEEKVRERTAALTAEIAERRRIEEELRTKGEELIAYSSKLEQSNRDLQDFAFVASHDLQEPVRKILTFIDLLKIHSKASLDERGCDYLERVDRSVRRMHGLIRDLLKYSRLTVASENFIQVDLADLAKEALSDMNAYEDPATRIEIGDLPRVEADPVQMRQLFQNLLANALKYRGGNTPVVKVYSVSCSCSGSYEIRVEDNGIGFDECYLEKIFKPFQRLHGRKAPYEGTGMGLAICRRIVERHGGSITARSEPGKGATFIVYLPVPQPGNEDPH
ncbi:MAG: ATP-binding protein [Syntrophobacter sp.]